MKHSDRGIQADREAAFHVQNRQPMPDIDIRCRHCGKVIDRKPIPAAMMIGGGDTCNDCRIQKGTP